MSRWARPQSVRGLEDSGGPNGVSRHTISDGNPQSHSGAGSDGIHERSVEVRDPSFTLVS